LEVRDWIDTIECDAKASGFTLVRSGARYRRWWSRAEFHSYAKISVISRGVYR
jgi:hypothetical protein